LFFLACAAISTASAQWTIGGNDLSADGVLGSSIGGDPWDLIFVTQGSQRMKISSTGSSGAGDFSLSDPDATSQFEVRNVIKNKSLLVSNESATNGYKYGIYIPLEAQVRAVTGAFTIPLPWKNRVLR
jgi:hypothetical protein